MTFDVSFGMCKVSWVYGYKVVSPSGIGHGMSVSEKSLDSIPELSWYNTASVLREIQHLFGFQWALS